jgi:hypothetical protein
MNILSKLLKKLGVGGALAIGLVVIIGLLIVSPFVLLLGLNLMGISIPYTFKTFLGAILVILILRPTSSNSSQ